MNVPRLTLFLTSLFFLFFSPFTYPPFHHPFFSQGITDDQVDLKREIAFNLSLIYLASRNMEMAQQLIKTHCIVWKCPKVMFAGIFDFEFWDTNSVLATKSLEVYGWLRIQCSLINQYNGKCCNISYKKILNKIFKKFEKRNSILEKESFYVKLFFISYFWIILLALCKTELKLIYDGSPVTLACLTADQSCFMIILILLN